MNLQRWLIPAVATALLFALLLFLFPYNSGDSSINSPLGLALWETWTWTFNHHGENEPDHSYCLLVPLMVAYVLYEKRSELAKMPARGANAAIIAVIIGLVLFWIGARAGKQYLGCAAIQVLLLGIICWFWGTAIFRKLLFAWAIIAFAWPLPFLDTAVAFPLRMIVSHAAYYVLNLIGIPAIQSGTALLSAPGAGGLPIGARFQIDVADPCSGLHSLLPLLMFSAFYCYFFLPKRWQEWIVFPSAILFTIVGNIARILMLVLGSIAWGSAFAVGTDNVPSQYHEGAGYFVFVIVLGLECLFGSLLIRLDRRWSQAPEKKAATPSDTAPAAASGSTPVAGEIPRWRSGAIFGFAALVMAVYLISPPVYLPTEAGVLLALPEEVKLSGIDGGHFYGSYAPVSDVEHNNLPQDTEFARKNYEDFHAHNIFFSIVLSGVQQYTIHPPEVCLVAQGWDIIGHEDIPIRLSSGHQLVVRNLSIQRNAVNAQKQHFLLKAYYMYWYVADNITTPDHATRNWMSSWDRVVHNRDHRWAYVIAMSPISQTFRPDGLNADQTRDLLTSFIRQIVPTFQKDELAQSSDNAQSDHALDPKTNSRDASL
jgi:exosortase